MKQLKCPACGETDEVYYIGDNQAICEICGQKWLIEPNRTKKQRKRKEQFIQKVKSDGDK